MRSFFVLVVIFFASTLCLAQSPPMPIIISPSDNSTAIKSPCASKLDDGYVKWVQPTKVKIPKNAVIAGKNGNNGIYICHGKYLNGVHPGQLIDKGCLISYAGKAILLPKYEILTTNKKIVWKSPRNMYSVMPNNDYMPICGGYENNHTSILYICRAMQDEIHVGKVVADNCNISINGLETLRETYEVLFLTGENRDDL